MLRAHVIPAAWSLSGIHFLFIAKGTEPLGPRRPSSRAAVCREGRERKIETKAEQREESGSLRASCASMRMGARQRDGAWVGGIVAHERLKNISYCCVKPKRV